MTRKMSDGRVVAEAVEAEQGPHRRAELPMAANGRRIGIAKTRAFIVAGLVAIAVAVILLRGWGHDAFVRPLLLVGATLTFPTFWAVLAFTWLLEALIPAAPRRSPISVAQDLVWFVYEPVMNAMIVTTYVTLLRVGYERYFDFLTIRSLTSLPEWARFCIGVVLIDFLYWVQHWLNHKVRWLWRLHEVHHSQPDLSFFSDYRYHGLEYVLRQTILTIPLLILRFDVPTIAGVAVFQNWYTRFYHGNIRLNLGPLRYLLVTPQSHRVHHSIEERHRDTNYGSVLSIWDRLFGTAYPGCNEYPRTGISNREFPLESGRLGWSLAWRPLAQMLYAFYPRARRGDVTEPPEPDRDIPSRSWR